MAYVEIEIIHDKFPDEFNCELQIHKKGNEITCACFSTDAYCGISNEVRFHNEEFAWDALLDAITATILKVLEND